MNNLGEVTYKHTDRLPVRIINIVGAFSPFANALKNRLTVDGLTAAAIKRSGLSDFGGDDFIEPLNVLVGALLTEAKLNTLGLLCIHEHLVSSLVKRQQLADALKKNPAIEAQTIVAPISIIGLPRTGTTILHELISSNERFRHLATWEADSPFPHPEEASYKTDPRIEATRKRYAFLRYISQGIDAIHEMDADLPQECILLQELSFRSRSFLSYHVPSYMRWIESCDMTSSYQWHKKALQYLQYKFKRERWILKNPHQFWSMDKFLQVYPDAILVQTHRSMDEVIPSITSLCAKIQGCYTNDFNPEVVGQEMLTSLGAGIKTLSEFRSGNAEANSHFIDIHYQDTIENPVETVEKILLFAGVVFSDDELSNMQNFMLGRQQHRHGKHVYKKEWFGLSEKKIDNVFGDYHRQYLI